MRLALVAASVLAACADGPTQDNPGGGDGGGMSRPSSLLLNASIPANTPSDLTILQDGDLRDGWVVETAMAPPHMVTVVGTSTVHIVPMRDFSGTFNLYLSLSNGTHTEFSAASIEVRPPVIPRPSAFDQSLAIHGPVEITLVGAGSGILSYAIDRQPAHGVLTGVPPYVRYAPAATYTGEDSFTFTVTEPSTGTSEPATVHLTISEGAAPVVVDATATVYEDIGGNVTLTASDPDLDFLSYRIATPPSHGAASFTNANTVHYAPMTNFNGDDSFTFEVSDGRHTATATATIHVLAVDDAPVVATQSLTTSEDTVLPVALTATDVEGDELSFFIAVAPAHGTVTGSGAMRIYVPAPDYHGSDRFTVVAQDTGAAQSAPAVITIEVTPVADPPRAASFAVTVDEDTAKTFALQGSDADGDAVSYTITSQPGHGMLDAARLPTVGYTPAADYNGTDSFTYTVSSNGETSAPATVTITVAPVDDAPVATPGTAMTAEDIGVAITLAATDVDDPPASLSFAISRAPGHGTISGTPPNVTYTPSKDYVGDDRFEFTVSDGVKTSAPAGVTITVTPVDDPPTPADDYVATDPGRPLTFDVVGNDRDPEGDVVTLDAVEAPAHGSIEIADGKLTYTPDDGFTGVETFTYTVADPSGATATATVHMGVATFPAGAPIERLQLADATSSVATAPTLSSDGRFVAFSTDRALVPEDTNGVTDVYLYDRGRRELARISVSSSGTQGNSFSWRATLSGNGRYVVYESEATNLVAGDSNSERDIFRFDRLMGATIRVSVATGGGQVSGFSLFSRISDDGDTIAFLSDAFELVANDTNGARDAFVHTVSTGVTERVSVSATGGEADLNTLALALSGDGHVVAFQSGATNLVTGDGNARDDVFVRDRVHGTTARVSVSSTGGEANGASTSPSLSTDGRFVSFVSNATNLVSNVTGTTLYVRDTTGSITTHPVFGASSWGWLSSDGRFLAASLSSGPQLVDRFAARSQSFAGGSFPTMSGNGRYAVSSASGQIIVVPNPF